MSVKTVPLDEIYRVIAGHSNYHGDDILSALSCIAEGKEVKPVRPLATDNNVGDKWIPVSERLPEKSDVVIGYDAIHGIRVMFYHYSLLYTNEWRCVTHWMPLPEPPKECE